MPNDRKHKTAFRRNGFLKNLKRVSYPKHLVFFDTETWSYERIDGKKSQRLKLGVLIYVELDKNLNIYNRDIHHFSCRIGFFNIMESLLSKSYTLNLFAHNVGFDLMVLNPFDYYSQKGYTIKPPIQSGFRFIWSFRHELGKCVFINTGNYVPFKLERLGQDLGFPKLQIDFDSATDEELATYCERDCEIIETFILEHMKLLYDNNLGGFKMTIASQALSVYRYRFMPQEIVLHDKLHINQIERDAYHGGRTECFFIGAVPEDKIYGLDINSMYPYVMRQGNIPVDYRGHIKESNQSIIDTIIEKNYCIVDCTLTTPEPFKSLVWVKNKYQLHENVTPPRGRKLIFPIGTFRTFLHHDEFVYAWQQGYVTDCHMFYTYRGHDIFSSYVDFFNNLKVEATINYNGTKRMLAKLYLNSLYGKFGQLFRQTDIVVENDKLPISPMDVQYLKDGRKEIWFNWENDIWREYANGESAHSFPAIAGCVTARARMLLWDFMLQAGMKNVYYCDTDSLYVNQTGYDNLKHILHDSQLGALALEAEVSELTINGAKNYIKQGIRVVKGVGKQAVWTDEKTAIDVRFEGFKEWRNDGANRPPLVWNQTKVQRHVYDKGIVSDTGHVKPYTILGNT